MASQRTPASYVYMDYDVEGEPWHEHFAIEPVDPADDEGEWIMRTADGDMYQQIFGAPDIKETIWGGKLPRLPEGLGVAHGKPVHRFS